MTRVWTIGYEGATLAEVIAALHGAGVELLVDVREAPISRKPGFSKKMLAASLAEAGIDYVHLRGLGTPKPGRDAAKRGDRETFERIYRGHMAGDEAQAELARALEIVAESRSCLLCYERDPAKCHRSIVLEEMAQRRPVEVEHLFAEGPA